MSVSSKRLRFEILKRDGFACRYCGVTAVAAPLHVDHVVPEAKGGTDDPANLVTACRDCNLGKSDRSLDESRLAASITADELREQAETVTAYLDAQKSLEAARAGVTDWLVGIWQEDVDGRGMPRPLARALGAVASKHRLEDIASAIRAVGKKGLRRDDDRARYFYGVLRKMRADREAPPIDWPELLWGAGADLIDASYELHLLKEFAGDVLVELVRNPRGATFEWLARNLVRMATQAGTASVTAQRKAEAANNAARPEGEERAA